MAVNTEIYNSNRVISQSGRHTAAAPNTETEPIAIIGIGCRFPGHANGPGAFWRLLCDGIDAIGEVPPDRWNISSFYDPEPGTPGKSYVRWGGFIDGIDQFDANFFGISPREAARMDPQQRLLLEVAYEAIEDAGQNLERLAQSRTGVFIGISTTDYAHLQASSDDKYAIDTYTATGEAASIAANRLSYCFDFRGPSLAVDTACSSSLVAVHLACQSIWNRESMVALAGGVNVILSPDPFIAFSQLSMLSPEGRCKAFDARANGFVRGEGVGIVVLKPISQALADGDLVYALIRATAVNQDGRTNGITVPNPEAQVAMLRELYQRAGVQPEAVQYVEAHGTGTAVGDPVEANALGSVLSANRPAENYCRIGSVKTNIGHLEASSGIAGLIKAALSLKYRIIPPSLHFKIPSPHIDFDRLKLRVQRQISHWPDSGDGSRLAGVNSFGFGGTNAHVLLSDAPPHEYRSQAVNEASGQAQLIPLSARSLEALKALAEAYQNFLRAAPDNTEPSLKQIGYNLSLRRTHHPHRLSIAVSNVKEFVENLAAFTAGETRPGIYAGQAVTDPMPKLAFVFSGQGPQWWAMGRELLEQEPVFRQEIERCDALLSQYADWSLLNELSADENYSRLQETSIAQPAIFALQVALAALWRSWGVEPEAVVGHSVGEVAAAYIAGVFDLATAVKIIFHRGRTMDLASSGGKMLAANLTLLGAEQIIDGYDEGRVSIASINSPSSVTLSGEPEALNTISQTLEQRGSFCRFLRVQYAFHSRQMEPVRAPLLAALEGLKPQPAGRLIFSTVTGKQADGPEFDTAYWWRNVRQPVRFAPAVAGLIEQGYRIFLEISPHPVLSGYVVECLQEQNTTGTVLPSLRRHEKERRRMLGSLGALHTLGFPIEWRRLYPDDVRPMTLPRYCWQHESHWCESDDAREARLGSSVHPLLGRRLKSADPTWRVQLTRSAVAYLPDHQVQGHVVFPATGYLEMALAAAQEVFGAGTYVIEEVDFLRALFVPETGEGETLQLQTTFYPADASFSIHSRLKAERQWTRHAVGTIRWEQPGAADKAPDWQELRNNSLEELSKQECYHRLKERGLQYGASFQGIEHVWCGKSAALGIIRAPQHLRAAVEAYLIHPAVFDACLQVLFGAATSESPRQAGGVYLPVHLDQVRFFSRPGADVWSHAQLSSPGTTSLQGNIRLLDEAGNVLVEIRGLRGRSIDKIQPADSESVENWIYEYQWQSKPRPDAMAHHPPADFIPAAAQMKTELESEAIRLKALLGWTSRCQEVEPDLNQMSIGYIITALRELGWNITAGRRVTVNALAQELNVVQQHHRLLGQYLDLLVEDGWLKRAGGEWEVVRTPHAVTPDETWKFVLRRFPAVYAELVLIAGCGRQLADVLQGKINALELIFPEGSISVAQHFYQDSPANKIYNRLIAKTMSLALERLPEGRRVRVLEIGGGTAGLTCHVLPELPADQVEYVFTDVSPLFLHKAEQTFQNVPFITYKLLDIEKDPFEQEFTPHSFDFILASNVLHATSDLRLTLGNIKRLLASQGLLAFVEVDNPAGWMNLAFGLTEGWWKFRDLDLRPSNPLLSREKWLQVLQEVGFSDPLAVSDKDGSRGSSQSVFVTRGPVIEETSNDVQPEKSAAPVAGSRRHWMIFADESGVGRHLAERLQGWGDQSILIFAGEAYAAIGAGRFQVCPDRPEDFRRLLEEIGGLNQPPIQGTIHCWSLDSPPTDQTTPTSLERSAILGCHSVMHLVQAWIGKTEPAFRRTGAEGNMDGGSIDGDAFAAPLSPGSSVPRLWLITRGAQPIGREIQSVSVAQSPLCGLGRVVHSEHPEFNCTMIDLSPRVSPAEMSSLCLELTRGDEEEEVALRGAARYVPRLKRTTLRDCSREKKRVNPANESLRLECPTPGVLDSLTLRETRRRRPGPGEVEIQVAAAALNFRDVMKALGIYPTDNDEDQWLGDECAGIITALGEGVEGLELGRRVMAIAPGCFGSFVITKAALVVPQPAHFSYDEAAGIPIAFLTAYYTLQYLGRITSGDKVLIQAATGGVGLAAVQIAQQAGAEVFATAGTAEKRSFLKLLGVQHVMDSRSLLFADQIRDLTGGRGVDLVLNSLAGEAIPKGLACLAPYGRFIEIGKRDIYQNRKLGLGRFKNNISFMTIDLAQVIGGRPELINTLWRELMLLFNRRQLHPLPARVLPLTQAANAFRHMAQARHIGKVVMAVQEQNVWVEPRVDESLQFSPDATYLITGGAGGFGLTVAEWLVNHGARHLALVNRRGVASQAARDAVAKMESKGAQIVAAQADVTQEAEVAGVLRTIRETLPPLRGVVHGAMVLDDGFLFQLNQERFKAVMAPKVQGAWNLHSLTLNLPLDFFILFSSAATVIGNRGQANYVAANSFLEALAQHRRRRHLPALAVSWGYLSDVGYVARHAELPQYFSHMGFRGLTGKQAVHIMEQLLLGKATQAAVMKIDWRRLVQLASSHYCARLSLLLGPDALSQGAGEDHRRIRDIVLAAPPHDRKQIIESYLNEQIAKVLGLPSSGLESGQALNELGLDSLMMVELKSRIEREVGINLPTVELMQGPSIGKLSQVLLNQLSGSEAAAGESSEPEIQPGQSSEADRRATEALLEKTSQLSEQEIDSLLDELIDDRKLESLITDKKPDLTLEPAPRQKV